MFSSGFISRIYPFVNSLTTSVLIIIITRHIIHTHTPSTTKKLYVIATTSCSPSSSLHHPGDDHLNRCIKTWRLGSGSNCRKMSGGGGEWVFWDFVCVLTSRAHSSLPRTTTQLSWSWSCGVVEGSHRFLALRISFAARQKPSVFPFSRTRWMMRCVDATSMPPTTLCGVFSNTQHYPASANHSPEHLQKHWTKLLIHIDSICRLTHDAKCPGGGRWYDDAVRCSRDRTQEERLCCSEPSGLYIYVLEARVSQDRAGGADWLQRWVNCKNISALRYK